MRAKRVEEVTWMIPYGHFKVIPGSGHCVHYAIPPEMLRVIRPFLGIMRTSLRRLLRSPVLPEPPGILPFPPVPGLKGDCHRAPGPARRPGAGISSGDREEAP
ncbi:MAG TPA: hypothetical protein VNX25_01935 [Verrucomicrobiae bacterium]|nr:hypothetical protein [Verrucomicrobiae bacterium]